LLITSVTLQKSAAETVAKKSQNQLEDTLRTVTEGFISYSPAWIITYVNPAGAPGRSGTVFSIFLPA
jgi:hypothetical protein